MREPAGVDLTRIRAAAARIADDIEHTPLLRSRTLSAITGADVRIKFENLQYTSSFKERGALNALLSLEPATRAKGVVAASAGNHAQGVAHHAGRLGIPATIVMPAQTAFVKVEHTRAHGAEVVLEGADLEGAEAAALRLARERGLAMVHPYDDADVIAGQGTVALEMLEAAPDLDVLVIPIGGGGLIAGCAIAAKALKPSIRVIGVETTTYPSMYNAIRGRAPVRAVGPTVADGIAVKRPGTLTRPIVEARVDDILLVDEAAIEWAVMLLLEVEKTVAEGAGAVGLAALLTEPATFAQQKVGLVLSGGNIDPRRLSAIILHGLVRAGRLARLKILINDVPGTLGRVANIIGAEGGNIVDVFHERVFSGLGATGADLTIVLETRGPEHGVRIIAALAEAGITAKGA